MTIRITYTDLGYDGFLSINSLLPNLSDGITTANADEILASGSVPFSATTLRKVYENEDMQTDNFATGSAGWIIQGDGTVEFNDGTFRGALTAATIDIGGSDATSFHVDIDGNLWSGAGTFNVTTNPFSVTNAGILRATGAIISGTITAGAVGGWTITTGYIYSLASGTPTASPNDGLVLASGNEGITVYENTEKRVEVGYLGVGVYGIKGYADDGTTVMFELSDTQKLISGFPLQNLGAGSEVAIQDWTYSGAFSVTDLDTVAWAGGTLTLLNGDTYAITGANTGNMAAFNYIFLDIAVSTTLFQVDTSFTAGTGKILIATAQNGTSEASWLMMGGAGTHNFDGTNIAASSIIAGKLSVAQLSAITADMGTITAGSITAGGVGGWTILSGYIYSLASGTPTASPNDGLVLASGNEGMTVYENTEKRVEVGYLASGVYGIRVYDDDGSTIIFEASDTQKFFGGAPMFQDTQLLISSCLGEFTVGTAGAGATSSGGSSFYLSTGGTADGDRGSIYTASGDLDASNDFTLGYLAKFTTDGQANHRGGYIDGTLLVNTSVNTVRACFELNGTTLYATTATGAAKTQTDVSGGITLTNYNAYKIVRVGSSVTFYINNTLVATNTTNLPTSTADQIVFSSHMSGVGAGAATMRILNNFFLQQSY